MIWGIMALHDLLSGPPMTDRQRLWRDIAEALPGRRMGPRGL
jgi:hypothetical protein